MTKSRIFVAEFLGTMMLLATVVGSGIMGDRLSDGNAAIALLVNSIATGAILTVLIYNYGNISGAHFNPVVTLSAVLQKSIGIRDSIGYIISQVSGAVVGVLIAHAMFGEALLQASLQPRSGAALAFSELVATFGLVSTIVGCNRLCSAATPATVGLYITSASGLRRRHPLRILP